MYWFKRLELFKTEKDTVKTKNLLVQTNSSFSDTKLKDFKIRKTIYTINERKCLNNFPMLKKEKHLCNLLL